MNDHSICVTSNCTIVNTGEVFMHFNERIAIVDGLRSPFVKSWSTLNGIAPVTLSTHVTRELLFSVGLDIEMVDQVVWGTVVSVPRSPNVAREVALNLGLYNTPGFTISRACASGFQSIASAAESLWMGHANIAVAGGVDVTSNAPVPHKKEVIDKLRALPKASTGNKLATIAAYMQIMEGQASKNPLFGLEKTA